MAFIREYMAESGDPFRFRVPRFIRPSKKLRKAVGKIARLVPSAASFIPGVGGIAGRLLASRQAAPEPEPEIMYQEPPDYSDLLAFARSYGWEGDPGSSRRKSAGAGPKQKASAKKVKRARKMTGQTQTGPQKRRQPGGSKAASFSVMGSLARGVAGARRLGGKLGKHLPGMAGALGTMLAEDGQEFAVPGGMPSLRGFRMGGGHRRINPTNVKALRRATRRLASFEKTVTGVRKSLRGLGSVLHSRGGSSSAGRRGHKAGCRCVACKGR